MPEKRNMRGYESLHRLSICLIDAKGQFEQQQYDYLYKSNKSISKMSYDDDSPAAGCWFVVVVFLKPLLKLPFIYENLIWREGNSAR